MLLKLPAPQPQVPIYQPYCAQPDTRTYKPRLRKPDPLLGSLSLVTWSLRTRPLLHAHGPCPHRNIHGHYTGLSGALVHIRNCSDSKRRRRSLQGQSAWPWAALQTTQDLRFLILRSLKKGFSICPWRKEAHWVNGAGAI